MSQRATSPLPSIFAGLALSILSTSATAQTQTTTQRLYLFQPAGVSVSAVLKATEEALGSRGRVAKRIGLLPSSLPDAPGEPAFKSMNLGPTTVRRLTCDDAYAHFFNASESGNFLGSTGERFSACVYPVRAGTRVAIVIERYVSGNGLGGALVGMIRTAVQGEESARAASVNTELLGIFRQFLPDALVELQELPGGDRTEPDASKVKEILASTQPSAPPAQLPTPASPQTAPPPNHQAAVAVGAALSPSQPSAAAIALDARKQLTAMGLTYHSTDAFIEAIRRKDTLAVDLFIAASSVGSRSPGTAGVTPLEAAQAVGDPTILAAVQSNTR